MGKQNDAVNLILISHPLFVLGVAKFYTTHEPNTT